MAGVPLLDLKSQFAALRGDILSGIEDVLESGAYVLGPRVKAFEAEIAVYCGTKFAVGCAS
jgi:dTDP-4-amino-4,6-dideoxygalactose transaminase